jgi:hypothetical protein
MWSAPDQNLTSPRNVTHIGSGHYQPTRLTPDGGTDQNPRRATGVPDGPKGRPQRGYVWSGHGARSGVLVLLARGSRVLLLGHVARFSVSLSEVYSVKKPFYFFDSKIFTNPSRKLWEVWVNPGL